MQNLIRLKNSVYENRKVVFIVLLFLFSPVILTVLNLFLSTIFNIGTYVGTFLRYLGNFIVY